MFQKFDVEVEVLEGGFLRIGTFIADKPGYKDEESFLDECAGKAKVLIEAADIKLPHPLTIKVSSTSHFSDTIVLDYFYTDPDLV